MPTIRADIIDVYVARQPGDPGRIEFLQLLRATEPMNATWQPVMGHVEEGETAVQCARRELAEEIGLAAVDKRVLGFWALPEVHPFFLAKTDEIVLSAQFLVLVTPDFAAQLNHEHSDQRWERDPASFMWPGQRAAARQSIELLLNKDSPSSHTLKLPPWDRN